MTVDLQIVCVYTGVPGACIECEAPAIPGRRFCSADCEQAFADREQDHRDQVEQERRNNAAFAAEVERLRGEGLTDTQIDERLRDMP